MSRRAEPHPAVTAEDLRRDYPEWAIRRSGIGRWWAIGPVSVAQHQAGCAGEISADDIEGLADLLDKQQRLREKADRL